MSNDPFELSNATIKGEQHVLITRQAARGGAHCTYWKVFQAGLGRDAAYWTDRENRLIAGLWARNVKRVVKLHAMTSQTPRPDASPVTEHIATFDAGLTVWQWLQQRPRYADGTVAAHPFQAIGAVLALASDQANYNGNYDYNGCGAKIAKYLQKTQLVGSYPQNLWRLYDMHGNALEWVQDCYHGNYNNAPDNGLAWEDGTNCADGRRVLRGGSWINNPQDLRSAYRDRHYTGFRYSNNGFRLYRALTP